MFYSHGGGFVVGSSGSPLQDGSNLAREYDVVVVSSNHRLGLLGYLYLGELAGEEYATSGNQGLLDIGDALKLVNANIETFGGDPDNVMIFGESGGGAKVSTLLAMPAAKGLFRRAAIQSGAGLRANTREKIRHFIILIVRPFLERMVMTLGTVNRQAHERLSHRLGHVLRVLMQRIKVRGAVVICAATRHHAWRSPDVR